VADWNNGRTGSDSRWCSETLYRAGSSGGFFLYGEGGALSRYSGLRHGVPVGRETIIPCSGDEADWWREEKARRRGAPEQGSPSGLMEAPASD
ncbi:MAG: hypothetical protein ACREQ9_13665, partial [Candidatus Binatia bacterium]